MLWKIVCGFIVLVTISEGWCKRLDDYISHYEELSYDSLKIHERHLRTKRSSSDSYLHIAFTSHGRDFNLRLRRDTSTLSKDYFRLVDQTDKEHELDSSILYEGTLWDEKSSRVFGSVISGVFAGKIITPEETYYVDRAHYYFKEPKNFHSIIYADKDIDTKPERLKRSADQGLCGQSDSSIRDYMQSVQNSAVREPVTKKRSTSNHEVERRYGENIYCERLNRYKRVVPSTARTCNLYLQTDTKLWDYMAKTLQTSDAARIREEIASLLAQHVQEVKTIYEEADFQYKTSGEADYADYRGISFTVHKIKINDTSACPDASNPFCSSAIDVTNFLNYNSYENHNDFCLAYVFTYRDFSGGTLGLAWVGSPQGQSGGICEMYKPYQEGAKSVHKSLNTGIVSFLNYGKRVAPKVSYLTFAHEVGHNFGSPHDTSGSPCTPYTTNNDDSGNFIMYASATSGDRANNRKFSSCSLGNMTAVVNAAMQGLNNKENCFIESEAAFCGNGIVEKGEECDCGYHGDCTDKCCIAKNDPSVATAQYCTRPASVKCSPSEGPCCNESCEFVAVSANVTCSMDSDCTAEAKCGGKNASCPAPAHKDDYTSCNDNTQVCILGECEGSICSKIDQNNPRKWVECFKTRAEAEAELPSGEALDSKVLCYLSCRDNSSTTNKCWSSADVGIADFDARFKAMLTSVNNGDPVTLPAGAACDNFQGFCDVFSKCRGVDADGPLARLKNLIFSAETFDAIKTWITTYWWAVALMVLGLILFMALFIKVCAVHTPSSNPNKKPARKLSIRPPSRGRGPPPQGQNRNAPPPYQAQGHRGGPKPGHGRKPEKMEMHNRRV